MTAPTVTPTPAGPPGYCGAIADELERIAADLRKLEHLELPEPTAVNLWMQARGTEDEKIAGINAIGQALLGHPGDVLEMGSGTFHYKVYGDRGPVEVKAFNSISPERAVRMDGAAHLAAKESELERLRAEVESLRSLTAGELTGLGYSREADDPTPVSPARVPLHTGAMTERGLVDETPAACICDVEPMSCAVHGPSARAAMAASRSTGGQ